MTKTTVKKNTTKKTSAKMKPAPVKEKNVKKKKSVLDYIFGDVGLFILLFAIGAFLVYNLLTNPIHQLKDTQVVKEVTSIEQSSSLDMRYTHK